MVAKHSRYGALSILILCSAAALGSNVTVTSVNGIGGGTRGGIAINATSFGRAWGTIARDPGSPFENPPGASTGLLGPIRPARRIAFTDRFGNRVDAATDKTAVVFGFKSFFVSATSTSVNRAVTAQAQFVDPLEFTDPQGGAFDVNLVRSFIQTPEEGPGLLLMGGGTPGEAGGSLHAEMSTNLTGFLFSLDLGFDVDAPLTVNVTLGNFVRNLPGWDASSLESQLSALLDAQNRDNHFSLDDYDWPSIPIHVPAGQSLILTSSDIATTTMVPEPTSILLLAAGAACLLRRRTTFHS